MELDNTHVPIKYIIYSNRDIRILSEAMKQLKGDFTKDLHRVMKGTIESDMYIQLLFNFENTKINFNQSNFNNYHPPTFQIG
jgi:hypothetical protein